MDGALGHMFVSDHVCPLYTNHMCLLYISVLSMLAECFPVGRNGSFSIWRSVSELRSLLLLWLVFLSNCPFYQLVILPVIYAPATQISSRKLDYVPRGLFLGIFYCYAIFVSFVVDVSCDSVFLYNVAVSFDVCYFGFNCQFILSFSTVFLVSVVSFDVC